MYLNNYKFQSLHHTVIFGPAYYNFTTDVTPVSHIVSPLLKQAEHRVFVIQQTSHLVIINFVVFACFELISF